MSTREIKENIPPKLLSILANEATINIKKNNLILETIQLYKNQINEIKNIFKSKKEENNNNNKINKKTKRDIIIEYITKLNSLKNKYNKEIKKIKEKDDEYKNTLFNNISLESSLENLSSDNFILENTLQKLDNELSIYKLQLKKSKEHNLFRVEKRDSSIKIKDGELIIYDIGIELQRDMLIENRAYNKCINKNNYYKRKIKEKNKKIEYLKNYIETTKKKMNKLRLLKKYESSVNIFGQEEDYNTKGKIESSKHKNAKKFLEDENYFKYNKIKKNSPKKNLTKKVKIQHFNNHLGNDDDSNDKRKDKNVNNFTFNQIKTKNINLNLINQYNEENEENENDEDEKEKVKKNKNYKKEKKKGKKKFDFLSIDELFDLSNYEGKNEAIIDEELHSNDEAVFETKIIPQKKIINDYIKQIKKEVPVLNLSQIEFNKTKVINEADLYSLQRRNFEVTHIEGRIKEMKKKIKKLKNKLNLNRQKYISMRNFINEIKDNYNKILRPLKIKSTIEGGNIDFKIQNLIGKVIKNKKNGNINDIKEKNVNEEELVGSDYSDEDKYEEDEKQNQNHIMPDEDDITNDENYNNIYMNTQGEIKTKIKLNLNNNHKFENRKNYKNQINVNSEDNNKFNSK